VQASQDLNVHTSQLRDWVKKFSDDPQRVLPGNGQMKPEQAAAQARSSEAEGGARYRKSRGLLREGIDMKFSLRSTRGSGSWTGCGGAPAGFYAWLTRPRRQRSRTMKRLVRRVRASFLASDRRQPLKIRYPMTLKDDTVLGLSGERAGTSGISLRDLSSRRS
jgi:hypothetical protein